MKALVNLYGEIGLTNLVALVLFGFVQKMLKRIEHWTCPGHVQDMVCLTPCLCLFWGRILRTFSIKFSNIRIDHETAQKLKDASTRDLGGTIDSIGGVYVKLCIKTAEDFDAGELQLFAEG